MFAIPGISALVIFILVRPQEFFTFLERVPFLHLFTALAALGYVIDVRLRRLQPIAVPSLLWVVLFIVWGVITAAVKVPEQLIPRLIEMLILFAIYGTIAHGIQRFRTFQLVAGVLIGSCVFIAALCWYEGISPQQCIAGSETGGGGVEGMPDGRSCEDRQECIAGRRPDQQGLEFRCEHVGLFNMYTIEGRTRYIGELHDPNEVSLVISTGSLSLLIGFLLRKKLAIEKLGIAGLAALVVWTVLLTQSRGGLITAMLVPGVYAVRKWGLRAMIPALLVAVPVMMLNGRSDVESANESTQLRYEAWGAGLEMFHESPIFGVGLRQFPEHHFITAHNSYVLTLGEMGLPGLFLFVSIIFVSIKSLLVGLRDLKDTPGAQVAQIWGMALLASMCGAVFQINTLSFAYHPALWILFGMCGAWVSAIRHHRPDFQVSLTARDIVIVGGLVTAYAFVILPAFVHSKGY